MLRRVGSETLLILVSVLLVVVSLLILKKVDDRAELANIKLGFPIHFVIQNSSGLSIGEPDSPSFPYYLGLISLLEFPARFLWNNFLLSIVITYAVIRLLFYFKANLPRGTFKSPR